MRDVGILGGGVSGLFLARFLGGDVEVLEADDRVGGLARSFGGSGFLSDIGGHILFSKDQEALAHELAVLGDNVRLGERANRILYNGLHVKYPFENGIDILPKEEIVDILRSFIENPHRDKPTNFREWMYHVFGDGLTDRYLLPYNEKIWKTPAENMSLDWVDRVPRPPLIDLLKTAVGIPTEGYVHQLHFRYPLRGGFESLPRAVATRVGAKVTVGFRVVSIRPCDGGFTVTGANGQERRYRQLIATLPVTTLLSSLADVPGEVDASAKGLRYNSLRVVLIGVLGRPFPPYTALYVPSSQSLYHRVCFNHAFSENMVPSGCQSASCEITVQPGSELDAWDDEKLVTRVVADMQRDGLLDPKSVCFTQVHREKFAYVVYDEGHAERMASIRSFAATRGIHLAGRFAEFQYVNTDACVRRALDLARQLRGGSIAKEAELPETS